MAIKVKIQQVQCKAPTKEEGKLCNHIFTPRSTDVFECPAPKCRKRGYLTTLKKLTAPNET
jgi:hypothetical protein